VSLQGRSVERYEVRFGAPRRAEVFLEDLASIGFASLDFAAHRGPHAAPLTSRIEIIDRFNGSVVRRFCDDVEIIDELYRRISGDLHRFDTAAFDQVWTQ
jgi:hypothetical protein